MLCLLLLAKGFPGLAIRSDGLSRNRPCLPLLSPGSPVIGFVVAGFWGFGAAVEFERGLAAGLEVVLDVVVVVVRGEC